MILTAAAGKVSRFARLPGVVSGPQLAPGQAGWDWGFFSRDLGGSGVGWTLGIRGSEVAGNIFNFNIVGRGEVGRLIETLNISITEKHRL